MTGELDGLHDDERRLRLRYEKALDRLLATCGWNPNQDEVEAALGDLRAAADSNTNLQCFLLVAEIEQWIRGDPDTDFVE